MSKISHITMLITVSIFLFSVLAFPGLASREDIEIYQSDHISQKPVVQLTFTPVSTIYLPNIFQMQVISLPEKTPTPIPSPTATS
ncbi:hypothetical protein QUF58_02200, partial [Anaerolineales bacterium HSG24]|nr:hypothetical protein [Anaerolineales bacterium HSG24]